MSGRGKMDSTVDRIIKLLNQTSGRDKIYRSCQYGGKFVWWSLEQRQGHEEITRKLKLLETHLGTSRKLFRIANSISFLQAALKSLQKEDNVLVVLITLSKLNSALYLFFDHLIWAYRVGLVEVDAKYYSKLSNRFWLTTIFLNLSRDLYEFLLLLNDLSEIAKECGEPQNFNRSQKTTVHHPTNNNCNVNGISRRRVSWQSDVEIRPTYQLTPQNLLGIVWGDRKEVVLDTIRNLCDLFLPASSLGYVDLNPGQQGMCGLISSLIGLLGVWDSRYKL